MTDHDPFSLGDSDDEEAKKKDAKPEDGEALQKAAAEAMSEDIGAGETAETQKKNSDATETKDKS